MGVVRSRGESGTPGIAFRQLGKDELESPIEVSYRCYNAQTRMETGYTVAKSRNPERMV
jgi:hypothetical protein